MFVKVLCAFLLVVTAASALPSLQLSLRQQSNVSQCQTAQDCNPDSIGQNITIPFYISCSTDGRCLCSGCFMINATINSCYLPCGTTYNSDTFLCLDSRKKQLTAFLLAFFLTWTGAANFYIARYDFAVPQLIFGLLLCAMTCIGRCVKECIKAASDNEEDSGGAKLCLACIVGIPSCILSFLFLAWWITDLVYFGTNRRLDGSGCALIESF